MGKVSDINKFESPNKKPETKTNLTPTGKASIRGEIGPAISVAEDKLSVVDQKKINELLSQDPDTISPDEGKNFHKKIQSDLVGKGEYTSSEVVAKNEKGETAKRVREVARGENKGDIKEEGTVYDLYSETPDTIFTGEIKPFSPSGVIAAKEKLEKQKDIEENYGGNHGNKFMLRELIFYDPGNGDVILRGDADHALMKAQELSKKWSS